MLLYEPWQTDIVAPTTKEEYSMRAKTLQSATDSVGMYDFYHDDRYKMDNSSRHRRSHSFQYCLGRAAKA